MPQTPIGLRLEDDLLRRVDVARGVEPRARFIARALELALEMAATSDAPRAPRKPPRPSADSGSSATPPAHRGSPSPSLDRFR